ncbi:MAG: hypothetical protein M0P57_12475 [Syntrophales bacterium]|jgi:hypothetical protein|nr:hypothetical protein [Syntrophales bacterium]MDY0044913.1 hypothetical protein [Syntrophales bacterium]
MNKEEYQSLPVKNYQFGSHPQAGGIYRSMFLTTGPVYLIVPNTFAFLKEAIVLPPRILNEAVKGTLQ